MVRFQFQHMLWLVHFCVITYFIRLSLAGNSFIKRASEKKFSFILICFPFALSAHTLVFRVSVSLVPFQTASGLCNDEMNLSTISGISGYNVTKSCQMLLVSGYLLWSRSLSVQFFRPYFLVLYHVDMSFAISWCFIFFSSLLCSLNHVSLQYRQYLVDTWHLVMVCVFIKIIHANSMNAADNDVKSYSTRQKKVQMSKNWPKTFRWSSQQTQLTND